MKKVNVIVYGVGSLGQIVARKILKRKNLEIVGAVERINIGKDLGEVLGFSKKLGVTLTNDAEQLFSNVKADVVIHMTGSFLRDVYEQIATCVKAGLNVISSCEELSYPYYKHPELAHEIDELAKKYGVTVLGTGINPGYLMDTLPIVLTAPCEEIDSIKVTRMMYSGDRRLSYQKKIGTGLSPEEFKRMITEGKISGHVGLVESIAMIAAALGLKLDHIEELPPEAVISEEDIETSYIKVRKGQVAGLKSVAHGITEGKKIITLEFISHANVKKPYDAISIKGKPNINLKIEGGIHGDIGTANIIVNSIPKVLNAKPGLATMIDLPIPSAWLSTYD